MFLMRRPSPSEIERFLDRSGELPLSYGPTGLVRHRSDVDRLDEQVVTIGHGDADFERARIALGRWKHFDIGWVTAFPKQTCADPGRLLATERSDTNRPANRAPSAGAVPSRLRRRLDLPTVDRLGHGVEL
jgi:Domain of unknown function (DUF1990)